MNNNRLEDIIKTTYRNVPYHNFEHGLSITHGFKAILQKLSYSEKTIKIIEPSSLIHDGGHLYIAGEKDEENAVKLLVVILEKSGFEKKEIDRNGELVLATIFSHRGTQKNIEQCALADADISSIGMGYKKIISETAKLYIETLDQDEYPSEKGIIQFYTNTLNGFFGYLTSITGDENNPFLLKESSKIFPNFPKNRDTLNNDIENNQSLLIETVLHEWKKFYHYTPILLEKI